MKTLKDIFASSLSPQEMQDEIFRNMSIERKLELASQFWQFVKDFRGTHVMYGTDRSKKTSYPDRTDS